jgi:hypothetical protein
MIAKKNGNSREKPGMHETGKYIIIFGIIVVVVGIIFYLGWGLKAFGWFGRLPGDIRHESDTTRFYFPIVNCIILSVALSIIIRIIMMIKGR